MRNHLVEQEIATGLWLCESFCAGEATEPFVLLSESDEDEWVGLSAALLQCHLLLQFLQFLWK